MKRSNWLHALFVVLMLGIFFLYNNNNSTSKLIKNHLFTIGLVHRLVDKGRGGIYLLYKFKVNSKHYESQVPATALSVKKNRDILNKRFLVMFYPKNPKLNRIMFDKLVLDSLLEAPPEGWRKEPDLRKINRLHSK